MSSKILLQNSVTKERRKFFSPDARDQVQATGTPWSVAPDGAEEVGPTIPPAKTGEPSGTGGTTEASSTDLANDEVSRAGRGETGAGEGDEGGSESPAAE